MSSRDIDSTSENVLHDWAREEGASADAERSTSRKAAPDDKRGRSPSSGAATVEPTTRLEPDDQVADGRRGSGRGRRAGGRRRGRRGVDRGRRRGGRGRRDRDGRDAHARRALAGARRGDLHIPDGYAVLEGVAEGVAGRSASSCPGSTEGDDQLFERALAELATAGVAAGGDHDHGRARRVRAPARRDGAREDPSLRVHRRAGVRHPRRHAALRLRLERGRERPPARRAGDGRPRLVRRPDAGPRRAGRGRGSARAPRPCAARSRWPISSRISGRPQPLADRYSPQPLMSKVCAIVGRSQASAMAAATPWSPRSAASTPTCSASACCSTATRRAPTSARAASRPGKYRSAV